MHQFIKDTALELGFDDCGIARAEHLSADAEFMQLWLKEGNHGAMHYLERNFEKRTDPRVLVPGCKSVVVVILNYYHTHAQPAGSPKIARYAWPVTDYHTVIKNKLKLLEKTITDTYGSNIVNDSAQHSFTDSAPVLERRWAQKAGLGWIGKHTQLISNKSGSYCFIGVLMLNADMEYDTPIADRCGTCTRCIDACPTKALNGKSLDARRCISYQTIENKNPIEPEFRELLSGYMLGCDICADVCPWNKKRAIPHSTHELKPTNEISEWNADAWRNLTNEDFNRTFKKSAITRAGYNKLKENIHFVFKNNELSG